MNEQADPSSPTEPLENSVTADSLSADTMTLAEREARWGFTLDELRVTTKVVRILFHNPPLFMGDPYLSESRLYTMIIRSSANKRAFRDAYKVIMREEKTRRRRFARRFDAEAISRTGMKREREAALNALTTAPLEDMPLLCDRPKGTNAGSENENEDDNDNDNDNDNEENNNENDNEEQKSHTLREEAQRRELLALVGAFENILRLEAEWARGPGEMDWLVASQLTAQVYRFLPHPFGTQMPPPLLCDAMPYGLPAEQQRFYATGVKLHIAHCCAKLSLFDGEDVCVRETTKAAALLCNVAALRLCGGDLSAASVGVSEALSNTQPLPDALRVLELFMTNGTDVSAQFGADWSAGLSLNLFIARRLYAAPSILACGESPVEIARRPPCTEDVEKDIYCAFDDARVFVEGVASVPDEDLRLNKWVRCHICAIRFNSLHPYYYSLCSLCAEFNFNKRLMTRDLRGKVVLLTGCRIKIGFAVALSLLRCGALLLGTTRFAHEALARFKQEADYDIWKDRLYLFSLDLRDMWVVTQFCGFVQKRFPKIFAIINNAAQTIARTPEYTARVRQIEMNPEPELHRCLYENSANREWHEFFLTHSTVTVGEPLHIEFNPHEQPFLDHTSEASQPLILNKTNPPTSTAGGHEPIVFDRYDMQAENSDCREKNSWVLRLAEVQGSEAAEVMAINALSPFIINSKLKRCLLNREGDAVPNEARFVINVSAMEGQFYRFKQPTHPHTNMAKAALNMMTRTSADDYAEDGIYMNSVDTGWITDEKPRAPKDKANYRRLCPLDEVDAAARCLFLIYTNSKEYGKFFKDFKETPW